MTLSQGIIKKWLLVFVLCFSMFFVFFPQSETSAATRIDSDSTRLYPRSKQSYTEYVYVYAGGQVGVYIDSYNDYDVEWLIRKSNGSVFKGPGVIYNNTKSGEINTRYTVPSSGLYRLELKQRYVSLASASGTISSWR
ncbi:hypothetical protein [Bacillus bingmayongensis]|uniref:Uncharacterized protein n=1 Tax=Bacillus bingmayongensis TaxID=1150157 RepID=A0ABU5K0F4_9BACI|nr:hypothetical protein [Bacillus bingmayongensis]MBY0599325.1 hypothetical protein [Bacillus bingmayongensis]MDZ5608787.1 hypothetical protein [Bacillus pseudomycoides]